MYHARVFCKQKKKEKLINRSREREGKKNRKPQNIKRKGRGEKGFRISLENSLFFFPPPPLRFRIITKEPTDRTPIFNLSPCAEHGYTDP